MVGYCSEPDETTVLDNSRQQFLCLYRCNVKTSGMHRVARYPVIPSDHRAQDDTWLRHSEESTAQLDNTSGARCSSSLVIR